MIDTYRAASFISYPNHQSHLFHKQWKCSHYHEAQKCSPVYSRHRSPFFDSRLDDTDEHVIPYRFDYYKKKENARERKDKPFLDMCLKDIQECLIFIFACVFLAIIISIRDDIFFTKNTHTNNNPSLSSPWGQSVKTLGSGYQGRINDEKEEGATSNILSYNEIMYQHFHQRIPNWRLIDDLHVAKPSMMSSSSSSRDTIIHALQIVLYLKLLAMDYQWDAMREILRDPILIHEFPQACYVLRSFVHDQDERAVIGYDWGSCAWRHCGALADAQEAFSELYNGLGLLEPYECLFVLDVIERSIRDIISLFPDTERISIPSYVPYTSVGGNFEETNLMNTS